MVFSSTIDVISLQHKTCDFTMLLYKGQQVVYLGHGNFLYLDKREGHFRNWTTTYKPGRPSLSVAAPITGPFKMRMARSLRDIGVFIQVCPPVQRD